MALLPLRGPRQPTDLPEIDWSDPLTKGLVFCAVPIGATFFDAVTRVFGTPSGALTAGIRARNAGLSNDSGSYAVAGSGTAGDQVLWPVSTTLRGASLVNTGTVLCLGGTTAQVDGTIYPMGGNSESVTLGDGFGLGIDSFSFIGRGNIIKTRFTSGVNAASATQLLGNPFSLRTHFFGYSFNSNGTTGNWLSSGIATAFSGAAANGTTTSNRRAAVLGTSADTTTSPGTRAAYVNLFLMWERELTPTEYRLLYYDQGQLFLGRRLGLEGNFSPSGIPVLSAATATAVTTTTADPRVTITF